MDFGIIMYRKKRDLRFPALRSLLLHFVNREALAGDAQGGLAGS